MKELDEIDIEYINSIREAISSGARTFYVQKTKEGYTYFLDNIELVMGKELIEEYGIY